MISDELRETLNTYFTIFRIVVPLLVLVLGTVDFAKAALSNEDGMKKAQNAFMKRLVIAVVIFLLPSVVNLLMNIADTVWGWNSSDCIEEFNTVSDDDTPTIVKPSERENIVDENLIR